MTAREVERVAVPVLERAIEHALAPFEMSARHVGFVRDTLVATSLDGIDTHGVRLLPTYVRELAGGRSDPRPKLVLEGATLDAGDALGVVAANEAIEIAIARAKANGVSAIAVRRSNHFGAAGYYTTRAAREDVIGFAFTNADALVAPFSGKKALNGTNPLSMAAPGIADDRFCLDMATSQVSYSKVMAELEAGAPIPPAWGTLDGDGRVATLAPLGGYKGQGLAMMVQILCAALTGMPFDGALSHLYSAPYDAPRRIGHFFICLDVRAFHDPSSFRARVSELLESFRLSPRAGEEPVLTPGDKERAARADRLANGVPLSEKEWQFFLPHVKAVSR